MVTPLTPTVSKPGYINSVDTTYRPKSANVDSVTIEVDLQPGQEVRKLYTIPAAAKEVGVPRQTLFWAVDNDKLPSVTIKSIDNQTFKVVDINDVIEWNNNRKPSRAGRKKSAK